MSPTEHLSQNRLLFWLSRIRHRHLFLLDIGALLLTPALALWLRIEDAETIDPYVFALWVYMAGSLLMRLIAFYGSGLYRRDWRYMTVGDAVHIARSVAISTAGMLLLCLSFHFVRPDAVPLPRSVPFIDALLVLIAIGALRLSICLASRSLHALQSHINPVLIVGAGATGRRIVKELQENIHSDLRPVGYIDDDPSRQGLYILDLPVFGGRESLREIVRKHSITQVIIAIPSAPGKTIREYLTLCEGVGVPAKTMPSLSAILEDKISVNQLRNVDIDDLLRREPVETDVAAIGDFIRGKRVLVTGGGGSIGSELSRQVLRSRPAELILLGHGENSIFNVHTQLQRLLSKGAPSSDQTVLRAVIADIRFSGQIHSIFKDVRPEIVFHAAAHKHVPLMEANVSEAISNNVFGTRNLLEAALAADADHFVMVSTDKAVNPTSVMGASKRIAELLVLRAARLSSKPYVAVRFGNVLGSRGSVVPTFKQQIALGGPVTVRHPKMSRYFMTIPEAVQLLLQASVLGHGGEVFMLDMGSPVLIVDLARDLIELSGLEIGRDIDIVYSGIRPGEKLVEELFIPGERYERTDHQKILLAGNASTLIPDQLVGVLAVLEQAVAESDEGCILQALKNLIPEFQPDGARRQAMRVDAYAVVENTLHVERSPSQWASASGE